jgi:hypothetical protein
MGSCGHLGKRGTHNADSPVCLLQTGPLPEEGKWGGMGMPPWAWGCPHGQANLDPTYEVT